MDRKLGIEIGRRYDLPVLTGTEKQIAYADDLRRYYLGNLSNEVNETIRCFEQGLKEQPEACEAMIASGFVSAKTVDELTVQSCWEYAWANDKAMMASGSPKDYGYDDWNYMSMIFCETSAAKIIEALK